MATAPDLELLGALGRSARWVLRAIGSGLVRFGTNRTGVTAVEFALVLPILLIFYVGLFEGARGFEASRKASAVAETACNLVTRLSSVSTTEMANIFTLSAAVMRPFPGNVDIVVTAVRVDDKGAATVVWSKVLKRNGDAIGVADNGTAGTTYALPADLASQKSTFFVEAKATYPFRTAIGFGSTITNHDMVRTNIFRPRVGDEIGWTS